MPQPFGSKNNRWPKLQMDRLIQYHSGAVDGQHQQHHRPHRPARHFSQHPGQPAGTGRNRLSIVGSPGIHGGDLDLSGIIRTDIRHVRQGTDVQSGIPDFHRRFAPPLLSSRNRQPGNVGHHRFSLGSGRRSRFPLRQQRRHPDRRLPTPPPGNGFGFKPSCGHCRFPDWPDPWMIPGRLGLATGLFGQRSDRPLRHGLGLPDA